MTVSDNRGLKTGIKTLDELYFKLATNQKLDGIDFVPKNCITGPMSAGDSRAIWPYESEQIFLTSAERMLVTSASADDSGTGPGLQSIRISGLDENYDVIKEVIVLNGTTAVTTVNSYLRINTILALRDNQSNVTNVGRILLTAENAGTVHGIMEAGTAIDQSSYFTTPRGYTCWIPQVDLNVARSSGSGRKAADFSFVAQSPTLKIDTFVFSIANDGDGHVRYKPTIPKRTFQTADMFFNAVSETNSTRAAVAVDYILIKGDLTVTDSFIR